MQAEISHEQARGCGYRKPSKSGVGIYLVAPAAATYCGRFPIPLSVCPCCSAGIKPSRSWTWIEPQKFFAESPECLETEESCSSCYAGRGMPEGKHGLLWIGEKFYPTPANFVHESLRMGISRKLPAVPRGFELGKTIVYFAHRHAIELPDGTKQPGVFAAFRPQGIDLVIADAQNVPERAEKLAEEIGDGARILQVVPAAHTALPMADQGMSH